MPKKIVDFLETVSGLLPAEAKQEIETIKGASDLSEVELTDKFLDLFNKSLLTREAAKADEDIRKAIKTEEFAHFYDMTDKQLSGVSSLLSQDRNKKFQDLVTSKKSKEAYELLPSLISEELEERSDDKEISARLKKAQEELNEVKNSAESEKAKILKEAEDKIKASEEKEKDNRIFSKFRDRVSDQKLIDNIPGGKSTFTRLLFEDIKKKYVVVEDADDIDIRKQDGDALVDVYENNEKLTLDRALEPLLEGFTQKSPPQPPTPPGGGTPPEPGKKPLTLQEMQVNGARKKAAEVHRDYQEALKR